MRAALKIAYDGTKFQGYAMQPNQITIEGEILKNLVKIRAIKNIKEEKFQSSSRTDRGVSAAGNVIAFNTSKCIKKIALSLNSLLDNIWIKSIAEINKDYNIRHAKMRWYRYYLANNQLDIKKIKNAADLFEGIHDFSNFSKKEKKERVREISHINISPGNKFIIIDIKAQNFLWNQVRRIIAALERVGIKKISISDISEALDDPSSHINLGIVPPENLLLMDIMYKDIDFRELSQLSPSLITRSNYYWVKAFMFDEIKTNRNVHY